MSIKEIIIISPRFGVLLGSMILSICFIIVDIVAVTGVFNNNALPDGINPFWKLAFVFKVCALLSYQSGICHQAHTDVSMHSV